MFHRRDFLKALGLLALAPYACTREEQDLVGPPIDDPTDPTRVAVSPDDPHYFLGTDGHPQFLLGFGDPYDWFLNDISDLQRAYKDHGLNYARVAFPFAGPAASVVSYTHERTGPGTALDGGLKFDINQVATAFLDRLEAIVSWGQSNDVYVELEFTQARAFQSQQSGLPTDWNWQGCVFNPANRIQTEAANLTVWPDDPDMWSHLFPSQNWTTQADREWVRDALKAVADAVFVRLSSYGNWWWELGNITTGGSTYKTYWASYFRGRSHGIDDGAVSPHGSDAILVADLPFDHTPSIEETGLVHKHLIRHANPTNAVSRIEDLRAGYPTNVVVMLTAHDTQGAFTKEEQRQTAWICLTNGAHYEAWTKTATPRSGADYLPDLKLLRDFLQADRGDTTIERLLVEMQPDPNRLDEGYCLAYKRGRTERYLVFAPAGTSPTLQVDSPGLTKTRLDATTGVEDADPAGATAAGSNALTGTGNDTAWWIA